MKNDWELSFGTFPGILFGVRTYKEELRDNHVLYRFLRYLFNNI